MLAHHGPNGPNVAVLELRGEVDIYRRADLRKALEALEDADIAVVDITKVTYSDLTLINGLVHLKKQMSARRATSVVRLVGAKPNLVRIFEVTNLAPTFEFCDSPWSASNTNAGSSLHA